MAHQALESLVPVAIGLVIDHAVATGAGGVLAGWLAGLAGLFLCLSLAYRFGARLGVRAMQQAAHDLRLALTRRILDPRGGAETGRLPGALLSTATLDALRVGELIKVFAFLGGALAALAVTAVALLRISVPLGLVVLGCAPPLLVVIHLLGKPLARRTAVEQAAVAHASGVATDLVAGLRILRGIGAVPTAADRYRVTSQTARRAAVHSAKAQAAYEGATIGLTAIFIAAVAFVGGRLALQDQITVGDLVAAVGLAQFLLGPMSRLAVVGTGYAQARASAARIADVLAAEHPVAAADGELPHPVRGRLQVRDLTYRALRGLHLDAAPGELVAVVPGDPAEATALLAVLARDADPAAGSVTLDGYALGDLHPRTVRGAVLVAWHDADLFEGTVLDNVATAALDERRVKDAVVAAGVDHVAEVLPDGLDTYLTEQARTLSGGQRQRLALARALATDAPVLVLADPTTAVDAVTEAAIGDGIKRMRAGRTTLVLASSPAPLAVADRVVVLADGAATAAGRHADLVATSPAYRDLALR
ncbi:MAG: ATP-binding cassette domain-containing protein [Streptosporangiales bacterium]|nr:ATP-binding cassette domain-containing protein [Streptosporangiales bacterium]